RGNGSVLVSRGSAPVRVVVRFGRPGIPRFRGGRGFGRLEWWSGPLSRGGVAHGRLGRQEFTPFSRGPARSGRKWPPSRPSGTGGPASGGGIEAQGSWRSKMESCPGARAGPFAMTILIVSADGDAARSLSSALGRSGHESLWLESVDEARARPAAE